MRLGSRLGVDVGSVRVGVAASDPQGTLAVPLTVLSRDKKSGLDLQALVRLAAERDVIEFVVGLPRSLSGSEGTAAGLAREYAVRLARTAAPIPVRLVDERLSTVEAARRLQSAGTNSKAARSVIDSHAAAVILEAALDVERRTGEPAGVLVDGRGPGKLDVTHASPDSRARRRRSRAPLVGLSILLVVVIAVVVIGVHAIANLVSPAKDYSGDGFGKVSVRVQQGDSETDIGELLLKANVIESLKAFTSAASDNSRAGDIGPGYYELHEHMSAASALSLLLSPKSIEQATVAIPEGFTEADIVARIADDTTISKASLEAALADPSSIGLTGLPAAAKGKAEGLLYPATYQFPPGTTATSALSQMVARYKQEAADLDLDRGARRLGLTPYQVLILASIVQREGKLPQYLSKIAEVFLNRYNGNMALGSNATLAYVLGRAPTSYADLHLKSAYNTEFSPGLPPTPINSPGELALNAVLHPAHGDLLYFVTLDSAGKVGFASTSEGFNQLSAEAQENGQS